MALLSVFLTTVWMAASIGIAHADDTARICYESCEATYTDCKLSCEQKPVGATDPCLIRCDESDADCRADCRVRAGGATSEPALPRLR